MKSRSSKTPSKSRDAFWHWDYFADVIAWSRFPGEEPPMSFAEFCEFVHEEDRGLLYGAAVEAIAEQGPFAVNVRLPEGGGFSWWKVSGEVYANPIDQTLVVVGALAPAAGRYLVPSRQAA